MSSRPAMTTTSFAILGLLAVKSWTTHELVQQVDRSTRRIWPRAQEQALRGAEEARRARTRAPLTTRSGDGRTRYTITAEGRSAFAGWLQEPGDGSILEFEQLLKISFADSGSKADILPTSPPHAPG